MKRVIQTLSIATTSLWVFTVLFSTTSIYSALRLNLGFGEPKTSASSESWTISLPFCIDNGGFYDISDLIIATDVNDCDGTLISNSVTFIQLISSGSRVERTHNISISIEDLVSRNLTALLFQDDVLDIDLFVTLRYAQVIPLQLSSQTAMSWGAPLANLSIGEITAAPINATHSQKITLISFENHSFSNLNGTMRLELVDDLNQNVGAGVTNICVPSMNSHNAQVEIVVKGDARAQTEARVYFETSVFSFGPVVMPLG